jgi:hypothetical protein
LYNSLQKILVELLYTYLQPILGAAEFDGQSVQLVTVIHDEGDDGLILCERFS